MSPRPRLPVALALPALVLACALTAWGMGGGSRPDEAAPAAETAAPPPDISPFPDDARYERNPIPPTPASIKAGGVLYQMHCERCHGPGGRGNGPEALRLQPPPANLRALAGRVPDGYLAQVIAVGGGEMPAYRETLSERELWDVVNFLQTLRPK